MALVLVVTSPANIDEVEKYRRDTLFVGGVRVCVADEGRDEALGPSQSKPSPDLLIPGRGHLDPQGYFLHKELMLQRFLKPMRHKRPFVII